MALIAVWLRGKAGWWAGVRRYMMGRAIARHCAGLGLLCRLLKYLLKSVSYLFIIKTCLRPHPAAALSRGGSHEQVSPVTPQDPRLDLDL